MRIRGIDDLNRESEKTTVEVSSYREPRQNESEIELI